MSENETQQTESVKTEETQPETVSSQSATKSSGWKKYLWAGIVVIIIILGVLYLLEKEGRSSTTIFSSIIAQQEANAIVAVVNDETIISSELDTGIGQFAQAAAIQGVDINSPDVQEEIRKQALDVLINTELLKQEAVSRGVDVSDEEVTERIDAIKVDLGGDEVLAERMAELGMSEEQLYSDIKDELVIQQLLEIVFQESDTSVSEEEILSVYEGAGGEEAGLPGIEEVREQVEQQIKTSKEQAAIDDFLNQLKESANIEIK